MKNSIIRILFMFSALLPAWMAAAQTWSVGISGGYNLRLGSQDLAGFFNSVAYYDSISLEQVSLSFGKGFSFGIQAGYRFNDHLGAEAGVRYLISDKVTATDRYDKGETTMTLYARMVQFLPSVTIHSGMEGKVDLYAKLGLVLGWGTVFQENQFVDEEGDGDRILEMTGAGSLGGSASIGASYRVHEKLVIFGECQLISMSYGPTDGTLTKATSNNIDMLPYLPVRDKEIEFCDNYSYDFVRPRPETEPSKELRHYYPFSSIGFNVGVQIPF